MRYLLVLTIFCCWLAGCSKPGTPVEYSQACNESNDGKYVEVSGYLDDGGSLFCSNIGGGPVTCGFKFLQNPGDQKGFSAQVERGTGASEVEPVSSGYKKEDIKIHDNSGNVINLADKVKITGKLSYVKGIGTTPETCFVTVTKIEKN